MLIICLYDVMQCHAFYVYIRSYMLPYKNKISNHNHDVAKVTYYIMYLVDIYFGFAYF